MSTEFQIKYGLRWRSDLTELDIELGMLRGKHWKDEGPFPYYQRAQALLWPEDDVHRWSELALETMASEVITVLMGPADSGKTWPAAKWGLIEYWIDPDHTLVLVSSTDVRGLELRVWGAIKELYNSAKARWPTLEGSILDHKHAITTDRLTKGNNEEARVMRRGLVCIPCMQSGRYVGLGKYVGIKQKRIRQIGDEVQLMGATFLDALPNYLGKDYKGVFLGNPLDVFDPLGKIAEPVGGWANHPEPKKTTTWRTRLYGGKCVNFVGTDSPNFDYPRSRPPRYPYMISWLKIDAVKSFWGDESVQYYSQCIGVMRSGLVGNRIVTAELCRQHHAHDPAVWRGTKITAIYALDPAYGGEDRCVGGKVEFGESEKGNQIIKVYLPRVYLIVPGRSVKPEDQIAMNLKEDLDKFYIQPRNAFYDPYGKGTLGYAFSRVFPGESPIPIDSGAPATDRPVRHDLYIWDRKLGHKRLKLCHEHYSKFSTEAWFSCRYVIECDQMRELPSEVMEDGCLREYGMRGGNKLEIESKEDTRERMGRSPDYFDWLAIAVEGCRQRGFEIKGTGTMLIENQPGHDPVAEKMQEWEKVITEALLVH